MAAYDGGGDTSNAEMESETEIQALDLSDYVRGCAFPQCVSITEGQFLSKAVQISRGDVLLLKSCDSGFVTLSYRDETSHGTWTEVNVSVDYPRKFTVLLPKDTTTNTDTRAVSMVMYPTIADLLLDCPTYFEATSSYDDPYLPGVSVKTGDRFWFLEIVRDPKDGQERLKVQDDLGNILVLSSECRGNFCPLRDEREYTIRELVELAPVQRRLKMVSKKETGDSRSQTNAKAVKEMPDERCQNEYTEVVKPSRPSVKSTSSSSSSSSADVDMAKSSNCLPDSFKGIIHLLKPESVVSASPFDDPDTVWKIPVSANLKVRTYFQNDYETPSPKPLTNHSRVPLPLSLDDQVPKFQAPTVPALPQPLVPISINNFVDIYCSTFPVKAKIMDTSEAHPFFQKVLKGISEVNVYRLDEARRLYVKDTKSDDVFSLSHDLKLSFIEYPEKFNKILDLLHLPVGSEVTVLEDIAADFPKPFSLRFGDVIRIRSNTPHNVKMKHASRDCEVIKCERIDPEGEEPTKLKLPLDFEVSMVMTTDPAARRMISLQDILTGVVPIPTQDVASVPEESQNEILKNLPVDLRILKSMKETCLVVASTTPTALPSTSSSSTLRPSSSSSSVGSSKDKAGAACAAKSASCSSQESVPLTNIGLPLTSGVVVAFRDRLDLFELDVIASEADYIRIPIEKMTLSQFEERERMRKLNTDYEDISFGSSSTLDDCGTGSNGITRTNSTGLLERQQKKTKMDKVRRLSRALNPKHWRHSKAEPEPLPHPSAMGLMALAARDREETQNDYHLHQRLESTSTSASASARSSVSARSNSLKSGSTATDLSSDEEEHENFYEDVEIGPIKSSTIATPAATRQTGAFSGPHHQSMPLPRVPPPMFSRKSTSKTKPKSESATAGPHDVKQLSSTNKDSRNGGGEPHTYDVPKPFSKAKNWATNFGNNIGNKFQMLQQRYDVPKSNKVKEDRAKTEAASARPTKPDAPDAGPVRPVNPNPSKAESAGPVDSGKTNAEPSSPENSNGNNTGPVSPVNSGATKAENKAPLPPGRTPPMRPPPPKRTVTEPESVEKKLVDQAPVPPVRRKGAQSSVPAQQSADDQEVKRESQALPHSSLGKSKSLNDSLSPTNGDLEMPKPRPRGLKKPLSADSDPASPQPSPNLSKERPPRSQDHVKGVENLSVAPTHSPQASPRSSAHENNRPKPPPKPRPAYTGQQTTV